MIEKIVEAPAEALEKTVETSEKIIEEVEKIEPIKKTKDYWHLLGPGLTTGAADDDPSGIATYSQTGAKYGFGLLWLAAFTFPLMAIVQEMCARLGIVTGQGLAANIRKNFPRWFLYLCAGLLLIANTFNIGADLGAMAKATQLLAPGLNFALLIILFAVLSLGLQIYASYGKYAKYLKYLALILAAYILTAFVIPNFNWSEVLAGAIIPSFNFSREQIIMLGAILGTTISPYLFFWQTSQEVEEEILAGETTLKMRQDGVTDQQIKNMRTDIWSGMFFSNLVMFFIIAVSAATLFSAGITNIASAADAAAALRPLAGDGAYLLFALGIIGTGMLAIPVLTGSSAYAVAESMGWKSGLYQKLKKAYAFYGIIIFSTIIGFGLNFVGLDPIKALIYSAVANGIVAPVVLVLIVILSSNKKVMGERVNSRATNFFGWFITIVMALVGIATIISLF